MRLAKANDECKGKYPKKTKQNGGHNENGSHDLAVFHLMYQIQSSSHTGNRWQSRWPKSVFDVFRIYTYNHHRNGDENAFGQRLNEAPPPIKSANAITLYIVEY